MPIVIKQKIKYLDIISAWVPITCRISAVAIPCFTCSLLSLLPADTTRTLQSLPISEAQIQELQPIEQKLPWAPRNIAANFMQYFASMHTTLTSLCMALRIILIHKFGSSLHPVRLNEMMTISEEVNLRKDATPVKYFAVNRTKFSIGPGGKLEQYMCTALLMPVIGNTSLEESLLS